MLHTSGEAQGAAGLTRCLESPKFPPVTFFKGRGYVLRSDLDVYKVKLTAFALGVSPPESKPAVAPDPFVPLKAVCAELGVGRRTIGRRIKEAAESVSAPEAA
jgi:hypothetical protein